MLFHIDLDLKGKAEFYITHRLCSAHTTSLSAYYGLQAMEGYCGLSRLTRAPQI